VDWAESKANFTLALKPATSSGRAFLDGIFWTRSLGFLLFIIGAIGAFSWLWMDGWRASGYEHPWRVLLEDIKKALTYWWMAPIAAGAGMALAACFEGKILPRLKLALSAFAMGCAGTLALVPAIMATGWICGRIFTPLFGPPSDPNPEFDMPLNTEFAGLLLLLEIGLLYTLRSFYWAGEPMAKANLGSLVKLQFCFTPSAVKARLEHWRSKLACEKEENDANRHTGPAAVALRRYIELSLWRDILGLIPTYTIVMWFALWLAAERLGITWLAQEMWGVPLWWFIPIVIALADYLEDAAHLYFLNCHQVNADPAWPVTILGATMATIKTILFAGGAIVSLNTMALGVFRIAFSNSETGWRGTLAMLLPSVGVTLVIVAVVTIFYCSAKPKKKYRRITLPHPATSGQSAPN
jgi:hypothetical protein